jgi:VWFA-related protein
VLTLSFTRFRRLTALAAFCALIGLPVQAQQQGEPSPDESLSPFLRANAPLVLIPVTVTDRKGKLLDGLTLKDFVLTDNGVPQKIRLDTSDTLVAPISLVIAVQASGISAPVLAKLHRVGGLFKPLVAGERGQVAVIAYDDEVRTMQDFTTDTAQVGVAIQNISGRTAKSAHMIDAVSTGVKMLAGRPQNNRRILLIIGEDRDRGSKMNLQDATEEAQRAEVTVFAANYSIQKAVWTAKPEDNPSMPLPADPSPGVAQRPDDNRAIPSPAGATWNIGATLQEISRAGMKNTADAFAAATGGGRLGFTTVDGLEQLIERAGDEIHSQYLLSFVPASTNFEKPEKPGAAQTAPPVTKKPRKQRGAPTGAKLVVAKNNGYHEVLVTVPAHPEAVIRVRPGYWAE